MGSSIIDDAHKECNSGKDSKGIWFHETNALMEVTLNVFIVQMALMNLVSRLLYVVLRFFKQPKFVCYSVAGVFLGYGIRPEWREWLFSGEQEIQVVRTAGSLGMLFFIFIIAVKMDVTMIQRMARKASIIGLVSFAAPCLAIFLLMLVYRDDKVDEGKGKGGFKESKTFYYLFAAGLSVTRFPNVAYTFEELDLLTSDLGQLVMSSAMVSEVFTWVTVMVGVQARAGNDNNKKPWPCMALLGLVVFTAFVIRPMMVWIVKSTPVGKQVRSGLIVAVLVSALVMAAVGDMVGSSHFGIFLTGLAVPNGPPLASDLVEKTELIVRDVLLPLFYLSIGYNIGQSQVFDAKHPQYTPLPSDTDWKDLNHVVAFVVTGCIVKFVTVFAASLYCKLHTRHAVLVGLMVNIKGPFDFWLFTRWISNKRAAYNVPYATYATLILAQMAITSVVTPIIEKLYNIYVRVHEPGAKIRSIRGSPSSVELRILFCVHGEEDVPGLITVLQASHTCAAKPLRPYVAHLNELVGRAAPLISPSSKRLDPLCSDKTNHIERAFDNYIKESNGLVMMGTFTMIAPYRTIHENICKLALEESIPLIIVPFHKNHQNNIAQATAIRHLNCNVQNYSPCTVGILVDNGLGQCITQYYGFSCNVAMIFIGGADDREALALGARMSGHKRVKLIVLRLIVGKRNLSDEDIKEKILDEAFFEDFRSRNRYNDNVQCREAVSESTEQALDGIRSLGSGYDLIIVGRERKASESIFDELMVEWSEYPELGMIGDFVSSSDFNGGGTSALVIQHSREIDALRQSRSSTCEEEYLHRRNLSVELSV